MPTKICSLSDYRQIVSELPRPEPEQVENFVQFVSNAHSWYKHLPLMPPGEPFFFFLNPFSGYDTIHLPDGSVVQAERTETSQRFHYTWMTTRTYRARFGHLDYSANAGTMFLRPASGALYEYADLPRFSTEKADYHLPPEVAAVGSVELTGVISRHAPRVIVWTRYLDMQADLHPTKTARRWPAETGGDGTLHMILQVCEGAMRLSAEFNPTLEGELAALLRPEKERLQARMNQAIHRVLDLLYTPIAS